MREALKEEMASKNLKSLVVASICAGKNSHKLVNTGKVPGNQEWNKI